MRDNEVVCLLADRDLTGDGVEVEFFGERTTLPGGPALLALRGGAPLLPAGCYFRPDGRHETHDRPADPGRARRAASATTSPGSPRTSRTGSRTSSGTRPTHWHLLQPNWPSDRGSDSAAAPLRDGMIARWGGTPAA